ncbi:hypothetical protein ACH4FX_12465 [Streptomyces sp. NPDC018019]|uniref:hypothetical protein n=1 Tax=Streptomyces sp. NPDC018019 TaxID=3365030 RepID=UPI0037B4247F
MATLGEIKQAVKATLKAHIPRLNVYGDVPDVSQLPAVVVLPAKSSAGGLVCDFNGAMGRGLDTWRLDLYVLVSRTETTLGQQSLDAYVSGAGKRSLRRVFFEHSDLGLSDGTDAHPEGISDYGGNFATASIDHVGAVVRLIVRTTGA